MAHPTSALLVHVLHAQLSPAVTNSSGAKEYEGRPAWMEQRRATNTKQQRGALWKQVISLPKPLKGGSQLSSTHGRHVLAHLYPLCALQTAVRQCMPRQPILQAPQPPTQERFTALQAWVRQSHPVYAKQGDAGCHADSKWRRFGCVSAGCASSCLQTCWQSRLCALRASHAATTWQLRCSDAGCRRTSPRSGCRSRSHTLRRQHHLLRVDSSKQVAMSYQTPAIRLLLQSAWSMCSYVSACTFEGINTLCTWLVRLIQMDTPSEAIWVGHADTHVWRQPHIASPKKQNMNREKMCCIISTHGPYCTCSHQMD